jgi:hypothetical protein
MKLIAINGSPRKKWNTATLLQQALDGAASQGFETGLFHLYDLNFKGCISGFSCNVKDGKNYGRCTIQDDLTGFGKNCRGGCACFGFSDLLVTETYSLMIIQNMLILRKEPKEGKMSSRKTARKPLT